VPRGQRHESLRPYSRLSRPEPLLFLPSSSSVALTRMSGSVPDPVFFFLVVPWNRSTANKELKKIKLKNCLIRKSASGTDVRSSGS
jgi:hypothetical protein